MVYVTCSLSDLTINPILQMRILRLREVKILAQGHTASKPLRNMSVPEPDPTFLVAEGHCLWFPGREADHQEGCRGKAVGSAVT